MRRNKHCAAQSRVIPEPDILDWPRGATETLERHVRFRMNSSHIWSLRRESIADRVCFLEYRDKDDAPVDASTCVRALNWQQLR
jgi:hypothetical protein